VFRISSLNQYCLISTKVYQLIIFDLLPKLERRWGQILSSNSTFVLRSEGVILVVTLYFLSEACVQLYKTAHKYSQVSERSIHTATTIFTKKILFESDGLESKCIYWCFLLLNIQHVVLDTSLPDVTRVSAQEILLGTLINTGINKVSNFSVAVTEWLH
jgi:hypothetical protein